MCKKIKENWNPGLLCLASMCGDTSLMVLWVMVLGAIITPVLWSNVPVEMELTLVFTTEHPVKAGVHRLHILLYDGVVEHAGGSVVVSLDGGGGCVHPISIKVWRRGAIYFAVMKSSPSSDSAAEKITNLMICATVSMVKLIHGEGALSDRKMWAPSWMRYLDSLLDPSSE